MSLERGIKEGQNIRQLRLAFGIDSKGDIDVFGQTGFVMERDGLPTNYQVWRVLL
jgi:hypothetical protein